MSVIPRDCRIVRKNDALPELFNLILVEANYKRDPQMRAIKELVHTKDPEIARKVRAMGAYLGLSRLSRLSRLRKLSMDGRKTRHPSSSEKGGGQPNSLFSSWPDKYVRCGEGRVVLLHPQAWGSEYSIRVRE